MAWQLKTPHRNHRKRMYNKYRAELKALRRENFTIKARREGYNAEIFMAAVLPDPLGKLWLDGQLTLAEVCKLYHWLVFAYEDFHLEMIRRKIW